MPAGVIQPIDMKLRQATTPVLLFGRLLLQRWCRGLTFALAASVFLVAGTLAAEGDAGQGSFRATQLFTQFNFYDSDSDEGETPFRYRGYGFTSGFGFAIGRDVSGSLYAGYMNSEDKISTDPSSRTTYDIPNIGGQVRYQLSTWLSGGVSLAAQRTLGQLDSATTSGDRDGWSVSGSPFVSAAIPFWPFVFNVTPRYNASHVWSDQPPGGDFEGTTTSASVDFGVRFFYGSELVVGVGATPSWLLSQAAGNTNRDSDSFFMTYSGMGRVRISGPLFAYTTYSYRPSRSGRSDQAATLGLSWQLRR